MEIVIIPWFIIRRFFSDEANQFHANVLMTSMLVIIVLMFWPIHYFPLSSIPHFCVFQKIFNIPCPGCGITRSVFAIAEGSILSALKFNPAGLFLFFYFVAQIPLRITALKFHTLQRYISQISLLGSKIVISVLFLVWIVRLTL